MRNYDVGLRYPSVLVSRLSAADDNFSEWAGHRDSFGKAQETNVPAAARAAFSLRRAQTAVLAALMESDPVDGRDISKWQNLADPDRDLALASLEDTDKCEFMIYRIGDPVGQTGTIDPYWVQNWNDHVESCDTAFLMAYWFFRDNVAALAQFDVIMGAIEAVRAALGYKLILFLDVETTAVGKVTRMNRFDELAGRLMAEALDVGVYSSPGFWNTNMVDAGKTVATIDALIQWVAQWTSAGSFLVPKGWKASKIKFWQKGISGTHSWIPPTPSIIGPVDYNLFMGSDAELAALVAKPAPPPPPGDHDHPDLQTQIDELRAALDSLGAAVEGDIDDLNAQVQNILADVAGNIEAIGALESRQAEDERKFNEIREVLY